MSSRLACLGLLAAGCAATLEQPTDELPAPAPLVGEAFARAEPPAEPALEPPGPWWRRFGDPESDALVEAALEHNLDLRAAAARLLAAEARAAVALGARWPSLDVSAGASRGFLTLPSDRRVYTDVFELSGALSWQVDLFGRLRAAERARTAEWIATAGDRDALAHALVARVLRSRVSLSVGNQRLVLARDVVESRAETLRIVEDRYARGVASTSAVDVRLARENLAAAQAALPAIERTQALLAHGLDELLGRKPGTSATDSELAAGLPETDPPPVGLPAQLVDRRPDLRAAAFRATAARAQVDVAVANLWPDLVIGLGGGLASDELDDLLSGQSLFGGLAADLAVRLFAGGALRAEVDAARADFEAQAADYQAALLTAVREVEDALVAERRLREELVLVRRRAEEASAAEDLARERYRRGLESLLVVLETERRRATAEDRELDLVAEVWNARIDLHLALGGNWTEDGEALAGRVGAGLEVGR